MNSIKTKKEKEKLCASPGIEPGSFPPCGVNARPLSYEAGSGRTLLKNIFVPPWPLTVNNYSRLCKHWMSFECKLSLTVASERIFKSKSYVFFQTDIFTPSTFTLLALKLQIAHVVSLRVRSVRFLARIGDAEETQPPARIRVTVLHDCQFHKGTLFRQFRGASTGREQKASV